MAEPTMSDFDTLGQPCFRISCNDAIQNSKALPQRPRGALKSTVLIPFRGLCSIVKLIFELWIVCNVKTRTQIAHRRHTAHHRDVHF